LDVPFSTQGAIKREKKSIFSFVSEIFMRLSDFLSHELDFPEKEKLCGFGKDII
jgi:hypothetical protein